MRRPVRARWASLPSRKSRSAGARSPLGDPGDHHDVPSTPGATAQVLIHAWTSSLVRTAEPGLSRSAVTQVRPRERLSEQSQVTTGLGVRWLAQPHSRTSGTVHGHPARPGQEHDRLLAIVLVTLGATAVTWLREPQDLVDI
jgi:hypothetical protein